MDFILWIAYLIIYPIYYYIITIKNKFYLLWLDIKVWYYYTKYYYLCKYIKVKRLFIKEKIRNYHEELKNNPAYIKYLEDTKEDREKFDKALEELKNVDFDKMN